MTSSYVYEIWFIPQVCGIQCILIIKNEITLVSSHNTAWEQTHLVYSCQHNNWKSTKWQVIAQLTELWSYSQRAYIWWAYLSIMLAYVRDLATSDSMLSTARLTKWSCAVVQCRSLNNNQCNFSVWEGCRCHFFNSYVTRGESASGWCFINKRRNYCNSSGKSYLKSLR